METMQEVTQETPQAAKKRFPSFKLRAYPKIKASEV